MNKGQHTRADDKAELFEQLNAGPARLRSFSFFNEKAVYGRGFVLTFAFDRRRLTGAR
jgi:hypothetical protein